MRAVTWIGDRAGNLIEIHVIGRPKCLITVWRGDASTLEDIRHQFAERVAGFGDNVYLSTGILLQLLLGTLDSVIEGFDAKLDDLRQCLDQRSESTDFGQSARRLQSLQSISAGFSRYSGAVRSATVGVETVPGMDDLGAAELDDYVERVEDVEDQLYERRRWLSDIMHDFATELAEKQGEQINRLTLVSLIFLPVTALTGFFGMNFDWLNRQVGSEEAFLVLGLLLPVLCVGLTIVWLSRKGLMRIRLWPIGAPEAAPRSGKTELSVRGRLSAPGPVARAEFGQPQESPKG
jgi:magnesium transporter